jgi:N-methylhydantoinase A
MTGYFEALVPRDLRLEVSERVDAAGRILTPLDETAVRQAAQTLRERGAEALVIHFIHAYANPAHEQRAAEIAREVWPNGFVSLGSEILCEVREFERGSTAALNGYVQPIVSRYLGRLSQNLRSAGLANELLIMQGNGGMMAAGNATDLAVHTVMSGPAAGAIAAARIGVQAGYPNLVACDMGGTSFDVSLIASGEPALSAEKDIAYGVPLRVPLVDIHTIGAGGGSIARVTSAGILQVGPESAGARPGPIAYGRGGTAVTVTDANLVLGRLNPDRLTGVAAVTAIDTVGAAIREQVGEPLGLDTVEAAAAAVLAVTTNQLANAIRLVSVEKGYDPRDFALFAFGGAGPLHAVEIARELGIPTVLVPRFPGITSGLGCVLADVRHDFVQSVGRSLADVDTATIDALFGQQEASGRRLLDSDGVPLVDIEILHEADLLFRGQSHVFRVPVASPGFDPTQVLVDFLARYKARFDIELPEMQAVLANLRTTVTGRRAALALSLFAPSPGADTPRPVGVRRAYFRSAWHDTAIFDRAALTVAATLNGPAIVEQSDATIVIDPGATATVDGLGNLVISVGEA